MSWQISSECARSRLLQAPNKRGATWPYITLIWSSVISSGVKWQYRVMCWSAPSQQGHILSRQFEELCTQSLVSQLQKDACWNHWKVMKLSHRPLHTIDTIPLRLTTVLEMKTNAVHDWVCVYKFRVHVNHPKKATTMTVSECLRIHKRFTSTRHPDMVTLPVTLSSSLARSASKQRAQPRPRDRVCLNDAIEDQVTIRIQMQGFECVVHLLCNIKCI